MDESTQGGKRKERRKGQDEKTVKQKQEFCQSLVWAGTGGGSICCYGVSVGDWAMRTLQRTFPSLFIGLLCSPAPVCVKGLQKSQAGAGDRHMAACMVPWHLPHVLCKQGCACLAQTELSHYSHPTGIWFCSFGTAQGSSLLGLCRDRSSLCVLAENSNCGGSVQENRQGG